MNMQSSLLRLPFVSHLREKLRAVMSCDGDDMVHCEYGRIYPPPYAVNVPISDSVPIVYNSHGEQMEFYFLRDRHLAACPYGGGAKPSHWIWDRYNISLKTHFYSGWEMLRAMGCPDRRYGFLPESPAIVPAEYEIFKTHKGLEKDFDAIFTYEEALLESVSNAQFVPFCAIAWYWDPEGVDGLDEKISEKKTKMVSICSSDKQMCELHKFRLQLAEQCKREKLADTFGTFDGGARVSLTDTLKDYRYTIAVENSLSRYFFTERITSSFLAMTVPIYCGTPAIGEFFNEDGIIRINPGEDIRKIILRCSDRDYESRLPAIRDNYQRALQYRNAWDWLHDKYLRLTGRP